MKLNWGVGKVFFKGKDGKQHEIPLQNVEIEIAPPEVAPEEDTTPDFVEPIVGWRGWALGSELPPFKELMQRVTYPPGPIPTWFLNSISFSFFHQAWKFRLPARAACFCEAKDRMIEGSAYVATSKLTEYSLLEDLKFQKHQHCTGDKCRCGLYACDTRHGLIKEIAQIMGYVLSNPMIPLILGPVYLWGRVDVHEKGYKADYAYPAALTLVEETFYDVEEEFKTSSSRYSYGYYRPNSYVPKPRIIDMVREQLEENYGVPVRSASLLSILREWASDKREDNLESAAALSSILHGLNMFIIPMVDGSYEAGTPRENFIYDLLKEALITMDKLQHMQAGFYKE